jgi:hypothetical protein
MRLKHTLVLLPLVATGGCQPLPEEEPMPDPPGLVAMDTIPAEWGQLVAVVPIVGPEGILPWQQLWFSEPTTGRVTLVRLYRPELAYIPDAVVVMERQPSRASTAPPESDS